MPGCCCDDFWLLLCVGTSLGVRIPPADLPPPSRTSGIEVRSVNLENDGHEKESIHRAANHWVLEAGRVRRASQGCLPPRWVQRAHVLQVAHQVRWHGG